jgi:Protein of unknown function (DUF2398)
VSGEQTGPSARGRRAWSVEADAEISAVLRLLEVQPWLLPGRDDAGIGAVRRNLDAVREAFGRLGWVLVVDRDLVRLRKSPPVRRTAWAASAPPAAVCMWFFLLVAAAESMPPRVALGGLVAAARSAAAEAGLEVSGTITERRAVAAALKLLDARGVIEQVDGDVEAYVQNDRAEVLLAVHHTRLVHVIANFADTDSPPPGPASAATTRRFASTCRPSSTNWASAPPDRQHLVDPSLLSAQFCGDLEFRMLVEVVAQRHARARTSSADELTGACKLFNRTPPRISHASCCGVSNCRDPDI